MVGWREKGAVWERRGVEGRESKREERASRCACRRPSVIFEGL